MAVYFDAGGFLDLLVLLLWPVNDKASTFVCWIFCFLQVNYSLWAFSRGGYF
jgi:hypothetical protein